ncbi:hypothetical protein PHLGIDRAFT_413922 [Phlebiopsis gigantea 11061_1 CR5-6]|uniref:Uncharacterized protein n=1 Tax=Phlebiopsis gigantea (strain 11061_1 CR5-6) TaxID=745531 RepID=A0A0C3S8L8_PHLG1|nr:hypothetical protein PHLGIDRAFT_413922 [Phlebiopsis gigantea 11061_1 CR5-6]
MARDYGLADDVLSPFGDECLPPPVCCTLHDRPRILTPRRKTRWTLCKCSHHCHRTTAALVLAALAHSNDVMIHAAARRTCLNAWSGEPSSSSASLSARPSGTMPAGCKREANTANPQFIPPGHAHNCFGYDTRCFLSSLTQNTPPRLFHHACQNVLFCSTFMHAESLK